LDEIRIQKEDAFNYLIEIGLGKWALSYDEGHRYDSMTTSLSECMNSVLKKSRSLPLKVLVETSFMKLVKYFNEYRDEASNLRHPL
jgi:hypothetical protein